MKTPTVVVTVSLTAAIVVLATLVIATGTRGHGALCGRPSVTSICEK